MQNAVGYLVKRKDGLDGVRGMFYDYVVAENGVFIEAEGPLLAARVPVAFGQIRGLAPLEPKLVLRYGLIPQRFFDLALSVMLAQISKERYVAVTWNSSYNLICPEQAGTEGEVKYQVADKVILDLHSHGTMTPWFSTKDNKDEQGLKLYGVVGKLDKTPEVLLRIGVYGYFYPVPWGDVFEGSLIDALDALELGSEPTEEEINRKLDDEGIWHDLFSKFRRVK